MLWMLVDALLHLKLECSKMKKLIIFVLLTFTSYGYASEIKSTIEYMQVVVNGGVPNIGVVQFNAGRSGLPGCTADSKRFVVDFSKEGGNQLYSLLMAAHMANREVRLWGTGQCFSTSKLEEVSFIRVY